MITLGIEVPQADIAEMNKTFERYAAYYKGNIPKAVEKTCVQIIKALRANTKKSSKLRPIVKNPDKTHKTDLTMAPFGVYKYYGKKGKYFSPIKGTGEYGKIRYIDKKTLVIMEWDKVTGKRVAITRTNEEMISAGAGSMILQNHPKRKIDRSGLAYSSWGWMLGKLGKTTATNQPEISGSTSVDKYFDSVISDKFSISMTDRLAYIRKALTGGRAPLSSAISRATNSMREDMREIGRRAKTGAGLK